MQRGLWRRAAAVACSQRCDTCDPSDGPWQARSTQAARRPQQHQLAEAGNHYRDPASPEANHRCASCVVTSCVRDMAAQPRPGAGGKPSTIPSGLHVLDTYHTSNKKNIAAPAAQAYETAMPFSLLGPLFRPLSCCKPTSVNVFFSSRSSGGRRNEGCMSAIRTHDWRRRARKAAIISCPPAISGQTSFV